MSLRDWLFGRPFPDIRLVAHHQCEKFKARVIRNGRRFDQLDREYERRMRCEARSRGIERILLTPDQLAKLRSDAGKQRPSP